MSSACLFALEDNNVVFSDERLDLRSFSFIMLSYYVANLSVSQVLYRNAVTIKNTQLKLL